jgi:hypothetical protein
LRGVTKHSREKTMDVYCGNCGEPCDVHHLHHDMEPEFREMFRAGNGCDCCEGKKQEGKKSFRSELSCAMLDILGDDIDGVASAMDDAEYMMGSEFWE